MWVSRLIKYRGLHTCNGVSGFDRELKEATMDYQLFAITPAAFRKLPVLEIVLILVLALVLVLVLVLV